MSAEFLAGMGVGAIVVCVMALVPFLVRQKSRVARLHRGGRYEVRVPRGGRDVPVDASNSLDEMKRLRREMRQNGSMAVLYEDGRRRG